ncbi:MAG: hypothetical protein ACM3YM_13390 [Sphingomonadales bacterium]
MARLASVPAFFGLRVLSALLLLKLSGSFLSVGEFAIFSQFMLFAALINLVAIGGVQNGLVRQAAAAGDAQALGRIKGAALIIWGVALPILIIPIALLSGEISTVLVGARLHWMAVVIIAALTLTAGPAQIWCSILSGRKRVASSLAAQAVGLLVGTTAAALLITRGNAAGAVIGFATGPLATMAVAFPFASRLRIGRVPLTAALSEVRSLLRYSAAFAATTGFTSITLFGLRSEYRESFGTNALGYWIAANRISDMSTGLLGLFMIQFFVPQFEMTEGTSARRSLVLRCWMASAAVMAIALLAFSAASRPLVHVFLSDAYVPAIPFIRAYLTGDFLRVWVSLAMFSAFAAGRPGRYAAIEIGIIAMMAIITLALIWGGEVRAPQFGYVGAYALAAAAVTAAFFGRGFAARAEL